MNTFRIFLFISVFLSPIILSCEKETTDHFQTSDEPGFAGFNDGIFTIHENSIGYYFPDSNKVFPDLYRHQNDRGLGNGIHSFAPSYNLGIISIEKENRLEFVDTKNFISTGSLELPEPRNIMGYYYYLVSYGKRNSGGIAHIDPVNHKIIQTVTTEIEAGKLFIDNDNIYVFSSGKDDRDSVIVRLFGFSTGDIHRIDSMVIGSRPVDFVQITLPEAYNHKGLAILCMGKKNVSPSIVILDLITGKIRHTYQFKDPGLKPENIFWIGNYQDFHPPILASYANNKLYKLVLSDPIVSTVLINKNISSLNQTSKNFIAVSRDTIKPISYLYKIDFELLVVQDSIPIEPRAKKIEGIQY
jgi:hypothetical protein